MNAPPTTDTPPTAPLALWRVAEAFMRALHMLFGNPEDVASEYTLTLKAHQLMASWLRCGEAMMRRLLLIEAAAYPKPNVRPLLHAPRKRARKLTPVFAETPEKWRVRFRCFQTTNLRQAQGDAVLGATSPVSVSLSLSKADAPRPFIFREDCPPARPHRPSVERPNRKRYKPILRQDRVWILHTEPLLFRAARPLAERYEALLRVFENRDAYARRLSRRLHATPHRVGDLFRAPPEARDRIEDFAELALAAESSAAVFNTS